MNKTSCSFGNAKLISFTHENGMTHGYSVAGGLLGGKSDIKPNFSFLLVTTLLSLIKNNCITR